MRLILASASPRRAELLRAAGYAFEICAVDVDERVKSGESAATYVRRLAMEKSNAAFIRAAGLSASTFARPHEITVAGPDEFTGANPGGVAIPGRRFMGVAAAHDGLDDTIVVGADTAVVVDELILGKPRDAADAARMLGLLSGRAHQVMTGISVRTSTRESGAVEATRVWFAQLSAADVDWYVSTGEGQDKAGAYAVQGLASRFIPRIDGSYSNVVGLPLATVHDLINRVADIR
jgi:septum formation protein